MVMVTSGMGAEERRGKQASVRLTYRLAICCSPVKARALSLLDFANLFLVHKGISGELVAQWQLKHDNPHQLVT